LQKDFKKLYKKHRQEINRFRYDMGFLIKMNKAKEKAEGKGEIPKLKDQFKEKAEGRTDQIRLKDQWKEKAGEEKKTDKDKGRERERTRERPRGPGRGPGQ